MVTGARRCPRHPAGPVTAGAGARGQLGVRLPGREPRPRRTALPAPVQRRARSAPPGRLAELRTLAWRLAGVTAFRYACYAAMTALALWAERRPAPTVPDALVAHVPYVPWVDHLNYLAWVAFYLPLGVAFLWTEPRRWARYMITGGLLSLTRGVTIAMTGLGAPDPVHAGPGLGHASFAQAFPQLLSPLGVFVHGAANVYLTKDLFFSGHTATTFLLVLYLWRRPRLRWVAVLAHVVAVASVVFAHLHYAIDIAGAYAFTFALYALMEWRPRPEGWPDAPGAG